MPDSTRKTKEDGKQALSIRLTADGHRLLVALAQRKGLTRTGVLELLIRQEAKQEGLE